MSVDWRGSELPGGVMVRLLMMRHGEPDAAVRGRCYGKLDVALSPAGRAQVLCVVQHLRTIPLAAIYTSPRRRASESAQILAAATGAVVSVDPRLAEMDFGDLEGRTYEEVEGTMPEVFAEWMRRPTEVRFPRGECYSDLRDRVRECLSEIKRQHRRRIVAIIAHGGVIRSALADALALDPQSIFRLDQSHAAVTCVDCYGDTPVVRTVNWRP